MGLFDRAKDWLPAAVRMAAGEEVTYGRGAESVVLTAVVGRTVFGSTLEGAARIEFGDRDYLVAAADLVFGGEVVEPREGDKVTDAAGLVFEVMTPATGEPSWRYSDPRRTTLRVHTKRVG